MDEEYKGENVKKIIVFGLVLTLSACSNPQDPTEANFKVAIQDFLSSRKGEACIEVPDLPFEVSKSSLAFHFDLKKFISVGLVNSTETEKKEGNSKETVLTLSLTDMGKSALKKFEKPYSYAFAMGVLQSHSALCYGEHRVVDILNFTEPADFGGQKISRVNFTYTTKNISQWTNNKVFQSNGRLFRDIKSESEPIKDKATLMLTNKGWVHKKLFRN